jgi:hypothetical protein
VTPSGSVFDRSGRDAFMWHRILSVVTGSPREAARLASETRERETRAERVLRRRLKAHGVDLGTYAVYEESLHPPGLRYPLSSRRSSRRRRQRPRRAWTPWWQTIPLGG